MSFVNVSQVSILGPHKLESLGRSYEQAAGAAYYGTYYAPGGTTASSRLAKRCDVLMLL